VDHPATQAWKRQLLGAARIAVPGNLRFVPVDFERDSLASALGSAGFEPGKGAMVSWLGVTPYLTNDAVLETLAYLAMVTRAGGGVAFDYAPDPARMTEIHRLAYERLSARVAAAGEPFLSHFDPGELALILRGLGFRVAQDVPAESLNARYFHDRADGLAVGDLAHIMWGGATPLDDSGA
jgi:methyltransferase (TIGR00027 family)